MERDIIIYLRASEGDRNKQTQGEEEEEEEKTHRKREWEDAALGEEGDGCSTGTRRCRRPSRRRRRTLRLGSMSKGHYAARGMHFRWQSPNAYISRPLSPARPHFGFTGKSFFFLLLLLFLIPPPPLPRRERKKRNHETNSFPHPLPYASIPPLVVGASSSLPFPAFVFFYFLSLLPSTRTTTRISRGEREREKPPL